MLRVSRLLTDWMKKYKIKWNWNIIATIFVGIASLIISLQSNAIYKLQANISKSSELPRFEIVEEYVYEDNSYEILISNSGGKCYNYESEIITFLDCSQYSNLSSYYCEALIPLYYSYYSESYNSSDKEGLIQTLKCLDQNGIVDKLNTDIDVFNKENQDQELFVFLKSYIKITYINFMGEEETEYYSYENWNSGLLDKKMGKRIFNYYWIRPKSLGIKWRENGEISVQQLLEKMTKISGKDNLLDIKEEEDMGRIILGIIIGVGIAGSLEFVRDNVRKKLKLKRYVALVYYDLKSLENYLKEEKGDVNLLYTDGWKDMLAGCSILKPDDIAYLYDLYNTIYNYNEIYKQRMKNANSVQKQDISYYDELKRKVFLGDEKYIDLSRYNVKYEKVIKKLEEKIFIT